MSHSPPELYHPFYLRSHFTNTRNIGKIYEERAAAYFLSQGYHLLSSNYRCPSGEIDLIVRSSLGVLVFVEVKSRRNSRFGTAGEAVGVLKQHKIYRCAQHYLYENHLNTCQECRFDVILFENGRLEHIENAF